MSQGFSAENNNNNFINVLFNNTSDYSINIRMLPIDDPENAQSNGEYATEYLDIQSGQKFLQPFYTNTLWHLTFSTDVIDNRVGNAQHNIIDTGMNFGNGIISTINGVYNFQTAPGGVLDDMEFDKEKQQLKKKVVQIATIGQALKGHNVVPRNANPLVGAANVVDGVGLCLKGLCNFTNVMKYATEYKVIHPNNFAQNQLVLEIRNIDSYVYTGIKVHQILARGGNNRQLPRARPLLPNNNNH